MGQIVITAISLWSMMLGVVDRSVVSYQNLQWLLSAASPPTDPTLPLIQQAQYVRTLDFMSLDEPITYIPSEIRYFINLRGLLYIKREAVTRGQSYLRSLKNLEHVDICADSKAEIQAKSLTMDHYLGWLMYDETQMDGLRQYVPQLKSANYCAYRVG